jgi:hypothetical protein
VTVLGLLILSVAVAVGIGLTVREARLRRTPEELRGDWWERFEREFRDYARTAVKPRTDRRPERPTG